MYAILEKGQRKFQKSVYARRSLRSGILELTASWRAYAFFKMTKEFLHSSVYA